MTAMGLGVVLVIISLSLMAYRMVGFIFQLVVGFLILITFGPIFLTVVYLIR